VTVIGFSSIFLAALGAFLWMALDPRRVSALYAFVADHVVPNRIRPKLDAFFYRFMEGLHFLRSGRDILMVFITSVFIWLTETVKYWFVMHAFSFSVSSSASC